MATERFRKRYKFWLNILKDDEFELAEELDTLKKRRLFTPTIRDGIRLIIDLRKGNTDVLFELFPYLKEKFIVSIEQNTTKVRVEDNDQTSALQQQIDRLEQLLKSKNSATFSTTNNVIPITETQSGPSITVSKAKSSGNSAQNFLNSMSMFN